MPSILIDFNGRRKEFEAPKTPPPWEKVVKLDVGRAPKVDVFYKTETAELHVKTFKFRTHKKRKVAITVSINVINSLSAKLITLDEVVCLWANGESCIFFRDGDMQYIAESVGDNATPTQQQFNTAAIATAAVVPPSRAGSVTIMPMNCHYPVRRSMLQALEAAGYTNIRLVDFSQMMLSFALWETKEHHQVGDLVAIIVLYTDSITVVRKNDHGYDFVKMIHGNQLRQRFPEIEKIIYFTGFPATEAEMRDVRRMYRPLTIKNAYNTVYNMKPYVFNQCDDENLDGYLVTMTTGCVFRIHYDGKDMAVNAKYELLPWKKTVEVDVGDASEVNVYMLFNWEKKSEDHIKQFRFTSKKTRRVAITIAIDEVRVPQVQLTTL
uniref:MSP domain-containing protein n=1 Tax=Panagrellus redivivus TaxID=6233 RepID=A0A7E4V992_PANRE